MFESETSLTDWESAIVRRVYACGAIFSVLGSFMIILSFIFVKKLRTMTTFLVFMLATSCLGVSLFDCLSWLIYKDIIPNVEIFSADVSNILCIVQAGGIQFFALSSFLWISCLAFHAFNTLCRKKGEEALRNYFKFFFVICYIFPAIGVLVCILRNALGQTEDFVWCWITSDHQNMRFAVYYIPLVIMWVFNAFIYILLSREKYSSLSYGFLIQEGKRRLRLYILVFVIAKTPALVNRLCNLFLSDRQLFVLFLLQAIFDSLFGFFESLVYITLVKKRLPNCCCHPKEEGIGLADPLIHRETVVPYSSIAERMYYSSSKKQRSINS